MHIKCAVSKICKSIFTRNNHPPHICYYRDQGVTYPIIYKDQESQLPVQILRQDKGKVSTH